MTKDMTKDMRLDEMMVAEVVATDIVMMTVLHTTITMKNAICRATKKDMTMDIHQDILNTMKMKVKKMTGN